MICLLLIMTVVFINGTESAEQKIRHLDTLLKEEEMNAKTKAWLLMVESGKVDQDELRRITPKSIFIAPLLTSGTVKCKEGYRHDHLGQCVKVIKIDPKVQLELLLQRLNKLYAEKNEEKEVFEASAGPLQFSLPISNADDKPDTSQNATEPGQHDLNTKLDAAEVENKAPPELIPIPLPLVFLNQTNQTKEMESSGAEPLNETTPYETTQFEGSGTAASGDEPLEESTTTESPVSLLSDETDYLDMKETESTTVTEMQSATEAPLEIPTSTVEEENVTESSKDVTGTTSVVDASTVDVSEEIIPVQKEVFVKTDSNSDRIVFPTDENLRTAVSSSVHSSRIRFPDEVPQLKGYQSPPEANYKLDKYQIHSSVIPQEQFWWLPKNWQVDENQQKSALVNVWSRLPLIHDITYSQGSVNGFRPAFPPERSYREDDAFPDSNDRRQSPGRSIKHFKSSRFRGIVQNQRQNFRIQR